MLFLSTVVNCALRFYNSSTVISGRKDQPAVKKQVTKTLNVTTNPEEKRKIIGDTFIKVIYLPARSSLSPNPNLFSGFVKKREIILSIVCGKGKKYRGKTLTKESFQVLYECE